MSDGIYTYSSGLITQCNYGVRYDYPKPAISLLVDLDDGRRANLTYMDTSDQIVLFGVTKTVKLHQMRNRTVMVATHGQRIVGVTAVFDINRIAYATREYTRWEDLKTSWRPQS